MKELTFREVIANIKEGEVWESNLKTIINKDEFINIIHKDGSATKNMMFSNEGKFKLQRTEYTFEEAFKAYEEGKEIESEFSKFRYKKIGSEDKYFNPFAPQWKYNSHAFNFDEIRGTWFIND